MAHSANSSLRTTGLAYDVIRQDLVSFLQTRNDIPDYDYADSAVSTLIDILAYNTYLNSFYTNMAVNESFIDTAELKSSVISRAKALNYTPVSNRGAQARVKLSFSQTANDTFTQIVVPKDTVFTSTVNSISYNFITPSTYAIQANSTNGFEDTITLYEGNKSTYRYTVLNNNRRYTIPNANVDTTSITVKVYNNASNVETYTSASDITEVKPTSLVYFLETDIDGKYVIQFGDGIIGKPPLNSANVHIDYRISNGPLTNGANTFIAAGAINGLSNYTVSTIERASGGVAQQSIDAIKFSAPRAYETQNRAVTHLDYKRIVQREHPEIESINVWGGEDNIPAIYGKVYIACKPFGSTTISQNKKDSIKNTLKKYNVLSVEPEFVDPTFVYLVPVVTARWSSSSTTESVNDVLSLLSDKIVSFESTKLGKFESNQFYYSEFLTDLVNVSEAVKSASINLQIEKRFTPNLNNTTTYKINFNQKIKKPINSGGADGGHYISSSAFTYQNQTCYFDDDGLGVLRIYYISAGNRIYLSWNIGTIDYDGGLITINSWAPTAFAGAEIKIQVVPESMDIIGIRNQILLISNARVILVDNDSIEDQAVTVVTTTTGVATTLLSPEINAVVI